MQYLKYALLVLNLTVAVAATAQDNNSTNLIQDGGFEKVTAHIVNDQKHIFDTIQGGCELGKEEAPIVYLASNFAMFCGHPKKVRVIEGQPGKEVYAGQRALALNGSIYIHKEFKARTGDVFKARYFARGKGKVRLILHLEAAGGKYFGQAVPAAVAVDGDEWKLVEHRLDTAKYPQLKLIKVRLEATGDVILDEISLVKETEGVKQ